MTCYWDFLFLTKKHIKKVKQAYKLPRKIRVKLSSVRRYETGLQDQG